MKKIFTYILTLCLLLSLAPFGAFGAAAANELTASDELIRVLKEWEGFSKHPYWDYKQWTVGYGTRTPDSKLAEYKANGIPVADAEALLANELSKTGRSINSFADKFGLTLTQQQFDALVSLSYNCGTSWLYKPGTLRTAVIEGWTGDDLIFAMAQWSEMGGKISTGLVRRRLAEAEMYLNGVYSKTPSQELGYVLFDPNGGECEVQVQGFVLAQQPEVRAVPEAVGFTFQGWYTDPTGGEPVTRLDASLKNFTLYAHWSAGSDTGRPSGEISGTPVDREVYVATGTLHSFQQPLRGALVVDAYPNGEVLKLTAEYTDAEGIRWGQLSKGTWINLSYTQDTPVSEQEEPGVTVTVTGTDVNLRRGPNTTYAVIGRANRGDTLEITDTRQEGGYLWGKSSRGWIVLKYTDYAKVTGTEEPGPTEPTEPAQPEQDKVLATGKVTVSSGLVNIRKGAGTFNSVVDYARNGMEVEVYETATVGITVWCRIEQGWISRQFLKLDQPLPGEEAPEPEEPKEEAPEEPKEEAPEEPKEEAPEEPKEEAPEEPKEEEPEQPESTAVAGRIVLSSGRLNIRRGPGSGYDVIGWYTSGAEVTVTERKTVDGITWGKTEKGWVSMKYVSLDVEPDEEDESLPGKGTVSSGGDLLRIRSGPGSNYTTVGYLNDGTEVEISRRQTVNGIVWGRIEKGWISLKYVSFREAVEPEEPAEPEKRLGTVKATMLYVRSGPGTDNRIVDRLYNGESVEILETAEAGGTTWGKIENGWVCMDYIVKN